MKVVVFSTKPFEREVYKNIPHDNLDWNFTSDALSVKTVKKAQNHEAIALFSNDDASEPVLKKLVSLGVKYVALRSTGHDHISVPIANSLGLKVANVPAYSPNAIAEHAVMLMLALNRKIIPAYLQNLKYDFRLDQLIGFDMKTKTVGIIGTGKIGSVTAKILHGFGCNIIAYDPVKNAELEKKYNVKYVELNKLYALSDIITLHCPLNSNTRYLINAKSIEKMKRGVMIINTARGAMLDTQDAWKGIQSGQIGYLGLDVYEKEKGIYFKDNRNSENKDKWISKILAHPNCILTAHQAFLTETAITNMASTTVYNLQQWAKQLKSKNELN